MKCPVQKKRVFRRSAQHISNMLPGVDPVSWAAPRAWPSAGSWPAGSWPAGRSSAGRPAAGRSSALDKSSRVKHCQDTRNITDLFGSAAKRLRLAGAHGLRRRHGVGRCRHLQAGAGRRKGSLRTDSEKCLKTWTQV